MAGGLAAGADLPSIRALAREQHVSVITVQRAYERLEREGLIHSRRGKGFFVSALSGEAKKTMARQRLLEALDGHLSVVTGPAFEGAEIRHGMRAAPGAIEKLEIDKETNKPLYRIREFHPY